ncbi:MAG: DUF4242 domain-containing protein [Devosia sp.]|jgi:hypothetical protein|nr:DUF4242 domain-containing protein [Devosiaceae bacterium]
MSMKRYVIEREVPGIGGNDAAGLADVAKTSNAALNKLPGRVHWEHSYVAGDKTFCVYLAEDEAAIREHARLSGFPANRITPVVAIVDPSNER